MSNDFYHLFPRAVYYHDPVSGFGNLLREPGPTPLDDARFTERHLHCTWFDPHFRPTELHANTGERVLVEHPGNWNLEAGPDFIGAVVHVGPERRRLAGDAEIHIRTSDWKNHGHRGDPNYANVRIHLTFYPGTLPPEELPPGTLQIAMQPALARNPTFSFEQIDLTAYPYEISGPLSPLRERMATLSPEDKQGFLDVAGEERLRRKTRRVAEMIDRLGADQALYEELMAALGYKHNKVAFRQLARTLPLAELRREARGDPDVAYALLLGISGLMPHAPDGGSDRETRALIRDAWDHWWKHAAKWDQKIMAADAWTTSHIRPANHPLRRFMAAAHFFTLDDTLPDRLAQVPTGNPRRWMQQVLKLLEINTQTYWTRRLSMSHPPQQKPVALVGRTRAINMLTNVIVPFSAAMNWQDIFKNGMLDALPCESMNNVIRQTAHAIFDQDHSTALYRTGLRRQGLIQIFYDYGIDGRKRGA